jgi:hypothetical protein
MDIYFQYVGSRKQSFELSYEGATNAINQALTPLTQAAVPALQYGLLWSRPLPVSPAPIRGPGAWVAPLGCQEFRGFPQARGISDNGKRRIAVLR